ncbi:MAG: RNA methyltransferase [bacterium]|nr:RNA methyltransferase [bacterium]
MKAAGEENFEVTDEAVSGVSSRAGEDAGVGGRLYIALLHHAVYDKNRNLVTTCVTNLDLHDISRVATTYQLGRFFVVHPVPSQRSLVERIMHHWQDGFGAQYNDTRREAFEKLSLCGSLPEAVHAVREASSGQSPAIVVTGAGRFRQTIGFTEMRLRLVAENKPVLLVFGTGWGLSEDLAAEADDVLEPIRGLGRYNHLSVRSAVSIIVDRLLGTH